MSELKIDKIGSKMNEAIDYFQQAALGKTHKKKPLFGDGFAHVANGASTWQGTYAHTNFSK